MSALKVRITEKDEAYIAEFSSFLVNQVGATKTEDPLVFELPNDSNATDLYHGLKLVGEDASSFEDDFSDVYHWLQNYTGSFSFYISLKNQLSSKGSLSPKQIDSVVQAMAREQSSEVNTTAKNNEPAQILPIREYSIKPGQVIVVGKWIAKQIAEKAGYSRPHYVFEVLEVEAETEKAFKMKVKLSAEKTIYCGVCGIKLTNAESIAIGIGPICADKSGIDYRMGALKSLEDKLRVTVLVSTWIPKKSIKEPKLI
jgi:hypothetical protein